MSLLKPVISIVTPTFNRKDELAHLITSLNDQTLEPKYFEMIICDDGSTDGTKEHIKKWQMDVQFDIIYIFQKNLGPSVARNKAVESSSGELIVFTDSDCEADKNWLKHIYDSYKKDNFDAFGGPDMAKDDFLPIQKAINFSMTSFFTTGGIRGHNSKMIAKFYPRTHNMGIKKKIFLKIGGFSSLRFGEDIELSNRVHKSGSNVKLLEQAIVYHRRRTSLIKFFKQVYNSGVARINLAKRDSSMIEPIHFMPSILTIITGLIILLATVYPIIFAPYLIILICSLILVSIIGGLKEKTFKVAALLLMVMPFQIFGYGLGFIIAYVKRYILKHKEFSGFQRNFY